MTYGELVVAPAAVEIYLLGCVCALLLADVFIPQSRRRHTHHLAVAVLLVGAWIAWPAAGDGPTEALNGFYLGTPLGGMLKSAVFLLVAACFAYSLAYYEQRGMFRGEVFSLGLLAALGMTVIISANSLLVLYLGIEILSLAQYALLALRRDSVRATESALKYFVLGALSSGLLLYGMSMVYGVTGELGLGEIAAAVAAAEPGGASALALNLGIAFIVASLAFKLGAAPFHMWIPDVYHGAPMAMTLFISVAPKVASLMLAMRLLAGGLPGLADQWAPLLVPVIVLSLAIGNLAAIAQTSIKRMLAYSAIAHMGYLLLGLLGGDADGHPAAVFYVLSYALMTLCAFGMLTLLSSGRTDVEEISDLRGLWKRDSYSALVMAILMVSMAGIPPTVGFYAKLKVLQAAVAGGHTWLAVVAVVLSVVGAYYYLRVIRVMVFEDPDQAAEPPGALRPGGRLLATANIALVLGLGIFPQKLLGMVEELAALSA